MPRSVRSRETKSERVFTLLLPAFITGTDDHGRMFHEETQISSINAYEARCGLKTRVPVGTAVRMAVNVPGTLFLGPPLKLFLAGEVAASLRRKERGSGHTVFIKLFKRFRLQPKDFCGNSDASISSFSD